MAFLFFWGIGRVPLAQAIALDLHRAADRGPARRHFLHERIGSRSLLGSIVAFAGVIVIVLGQAHAKLGGEVLLGTAAIIGSALCYAANIVMMRRQAVAAKPLEINFFQSSVVMILWLAALPFVGMPAWPSEQWPWVDRRGLDVEQRHLAVRLRLRAGRSELSRGHRI